MRSGWCLEDLLAGAVALVDQIEISESVDRDSMVPTASGLLHHLAVPVQTERREVLELTLLCAFPHPVQVLDP
jgi:hypothetical protein